MGSALEDIEFLALSANRVNVLQLLAEGPKTRDELANTTGVSQATLGRILGDFQDRSWVRRDGSTYVATLTGRLVVRGFTNLQAMLETERELRDVVTYLPTELRDLDPQALTDAQVTTPTRTHPNAPLRRLLGILEDASTVQTVSYAFNEQTLRTIKKRVDAGAQSFEGIFSRRAIADLRADPTLCEEFTSLLRADATEVYLVEEAPIAVLVADDVVYLLVRDEDGVLRGAIDTMTPDAQSWAAELIAQYRSVAEPLTPAGFQQFDS